MGKNKKNNKVFKIAGAKSLKKSKAKAVNLGLKNIKKKVEDIDAEFLEINKKTKPIPKPPQKQNKKSVKKPQKSVPSKEDISKTVEQIVKMEV